MTFAMVITASRSGSGNPPFSAQHSLRNVAESPHIFYIPTLSDMREVTFRGMGDQILIHHIQFVLTN